MTDVVRPAVVAEDRDSGDMSARHLDDNVDGKRGSWLVRHMTALTVASALVTPLLYLFYVNHYSLNVFQFDDWGSVGFLNAAIHGHLTFNELWVQHHEDRLFLQNIILVLFAFIDRFDLRSVILAGAAVFIATYGLLLVLFQRYISTPLKPIPVLIVGVVWFSIGDFSNALTLSLALYLQLFFFLAMLVAFVVPNKHRGLWFSIALVAAIASSLSVIQGFLVWPLGAICILWCQPWARRAQWEVGIWILAMVGTLVVYLPGYQGSGCDIAHCSVSGSLAHPGLTVQSFLVVLGGVIPGGAPLGGPGASSFGRFEVVGLALLAASAFIVIQSWRNRSTRERIPLPMLLICFCLLADAMTVLGRSAVGLDALVNSNRYMLPNQILLVAIIMYAWAHLPNPRLISRERLWRASMTWLALFLLGILVVAQVSISTSFGLANGRAENHFLTQQARLLINLDKVPVQDRSCELSDVLWLGLAPASTYSAQRLVAEKDRFGEFQSNSYYEKLGPPPLLPICSKAGGSAPPF